MGVHAHPRVYVEGTYMWVRAIARVYVVYMRACVRVRAYERRLCSCASNKCVCVRVCVRACACVRALAYVYARARMSMFTRAPDLECLSGRVRTSMHARHSLSHRWIEV